MCAPVAYSCVTCTDTTTGIYTYTLHIASQDAVLWWYIYLCWYPTLCVGASGTRYCIHTYVHLYMLRVVLVYGVLWVYSRYLLLGTSYATYILCSTSCGCIYAGMYSISCWYDILWVYLYTTSCVAGMWYVWIRCKDMYTTTPLSVYAVYLYR